MNKENFVAIKPMLGLSNRLRTISSAMAISERFHKKLYICWTPGPGFSDEKFTFLFEGDFNLISEEDYHNLAEQNTEAILNKLFYKDEGHNIRILDGFSYDFFLEGIKASQPLVYEGSESLIDIFERFPGHNCKGLRHEYFEQLRKITPSKEIKADIDKFVEKNFHTEIIVGVHIRRGDTKKCPYGHMYKSLSDEPFITKLEKELSLNPGVKFLLSTDCEQTFKKFKAIFDDRIISYPKSFVKSEFGAEKLNQKDALIELMLLSKTTKIIGSHWSSFSQMASDIGNIPIHYCLANEVETKKK